MNSLKPLFLVVLALVASNSFAQTVALKPKADEGGANTGNIVYKAPTEMGILRTEIKYRNNGAAWILLTLNDLNTPEGGMPYYEEKKIEVPGMSYDPATREVLYNGKVCGFKRNGIAAIAYGSAKVSSDCELSAGIVNKVSYVLDTDGEKQPIKTTRYVVVRFGNI